MTAEVIYQLKHEYGRKVTFLHKLTSTTDVITGQLSETFALYPVNKAIKLENHFRQALARILNQQQKIGFQLAGDFQLIIAKRDVSSVLIVGDTVVTEFGTGKIIKIDDFDAAYMFSIEICPQALSISLADNLTFVSSGQSSFSIRTITSISAMQDGSYLVTFSAPPSAVTSLSGLVIGGLAIDFFTWNPGDSFLTAGTTEASSPGQTWTSSSVSGVIINGSSLTNSSGVTV